MDLYKLIAFLEKTVIQQEECISEQKERISELEKLHDKAYTNGYDLGRKHGVESEKFFKQP